MKSFNRGLIFLTLLGLTWINQFLFQLAKPLSLAGVDPALATFILKHYMNVIFSGNWGDILTVPMYYGLNYSLFLTDHHFIFALAGLPIFVVTRDIILTTNLLSVLAILFSLYAMYIFTFYLTKKILPSILAAVIFALNPYIGSHFPDHLILITVGWIPLIFLFFEKSLEKPSNKNLFLFFLFLTCQLLSSLYYSAFLTIILPLYTGIRLWQKKPVLKKFINRGAVGGIILFVFFALGSAYFYTRAANETKNFVYEPTVVSFHAPRSQRIAENFSPRVSDLLFDPMHKNVVRSLIAERYGQFTTDRPHVNEKTIFLGFILLALTIVSIFTLYNSKKWRLWFGLMIISLFLSLGPTIRLTENIAVPGPYRLAQAINPLYDFLRAPGRMAVFSFFFLGLISAGVLSDFQNRIRGKKGILLGCFLILLITIEYLNWSLQFTHISQEQVKFYQVLNDTDHIRVIVDLPMGLQTSGFNKWTPDSHNLLWATLLHSKKTLNGGNAFEPHQYQHLAKVTLGIGFPRVDQLELLKRLGVDGIVLHRENYNSPAEFNLNVRALKALQIPALIVTDNLALFDLTKK